MRDRLWSKNWKHRCFFTRLSQHTIDTILFTRKNKGIPCVPFIVRIPAVKQNVSTPVIVILQSLKTTAIQVILWFWMLQVNTCNNAAKEYGTQLQFNWFITLESCEALLNFLSDLFNLFEKNSKQNFEYYTYATKCDEHSHYTTSNIVLWCPHFIFKLSGHKNTAFNH